MSTPSPDFVSETAYAIIFGIGVVVVVITIAITCYFCRTRVWRSGINLSNLRASPIAAAVSAKQGLDEGLIGTYPKLMYSQVKLQYGNLVGSCCSICLTDYKDDEMLLLLPSCAHFFHQNCGNQWLQLHPTCPICRKSPANNLVSDSDSVLVSVSDPVHQLVPSSLEPVINP